MQKFNRALTREIEVGGERLAVTLSEQGLSFRVVGTRKPPYEMTWAECLCACTRGGEHTPTADEVEAALKALRAGGKERLGAPKAPTEAPAPEQPAPPAVHQQPATGHQTPAHEPAATHHHAPAHEPAPLEQPGAERTTRAPAAKQLPALLARLDAWLSKHRSRFAKGLLPGATADQLAELEHNLGQPLPDELGAWLSWHNGQSPDVAGAFVQSWHLLGAQQIASVKKELDAEPPANWTGDWIPILDDDNDNYVCLDPRQPGCPVRECWRGKQEHPVVAGSLTEWVARLATDLEKGEYVEDPERGELFKKG